MNLVERLDADGIVILPGFVEGTMLRSMQKAFEARLRRIRWNDVDGYEKTERFRHMVQDVLTLEQGFVDVAIHPLIQETLRACIGDNFALVEAKGWKSLPTRRMFHGWHADAWYDQSKVTCIPREIKLAFYLTDVKTGAFQYVRGSHRQEAPRIWRSHEVERFPADHIIEAAGPAGTAFLFDTTGVHRQSCPVLEPRHAVFYNYHDPSVPLQAEDIDYYRYHPLLLNAAFLGNLTPEDRRILGFGDKTNYLPTFERKAVHRRFHAGHSAAFNMKILVDELRSRVAARLARLFREG